GARASAAGAAAVVDGAVADPVPLRRTADRAVAVRELGLAGSLVVRLASTFGLGAGGGAASVEGAGANGSAVASTDVSATGSGGAAVSWANDAVEVKARAAAIAVMAFVGCSILSVMTDQPAAAAVRRAVSDGPGLAYDKRNARPLT
ncbi:MAG TPA: hypothetical protein VFO32_08705, partial [Sphingomicrobium sp.]|nr:hypothetical protein [Sphingomicrobium sp.]